MVERGGVKQPQVRWGASVLEGGGEKYKTRVLWSEVAFQAIQVSAR